MFRGLGARPERVVAPAAAGVPAAKPSAFGILFGETRPAPPELAVDAWLWTPGLDAATVAREAEARTGLACAELVGRFESLGNDCEFGFVQRHFGCETLGLFRFSNPLHEVVRRQIETDFATFGDRSTVVLDRQVPRREWIVVDPDLGLREHTFIWEGERPEAEVRNTSLTRLRFLKRKMVETMREGSKIFVIKSGEGHVDLAAATAIARALRQRGPNWLLWVEAGAEACSEACAEASAEAGRVRRIEQGLLHGTIDRLTVQGGGVAPSYACWLMIAARAHLAAASG